MCSDSCFGSQDFKYSLLALLYLKYKKLTPLISFPKNINMSGSGISSSSTFVILSIASQHKASGLK